MLIVLAVFGVRYCTGSSRKRFDPKPPVELIPTTTSAVPVYDYERETSDQPSAPQVLIMPRRPAPAPPTSAPPPPEPALPPDWEAHEDNDGNVYYYNVLTKVSQWESPA